MDADAMVTKARAVATAAHAGQTRWHGEPYITHPEHLAAQFRGEPVLQAVALLHDVVEDTPVTLDDLRRDFPEEVVEAVDALTQRSGESYLELIRRSRDHPIARRVRIADIRHNMGKLKRGSMRDKFDLALDMLEAAKR